MKLAFHPVLRSLECLFYRGSGTSRILKKQICQRFSLFQVCFSMGFIQVPIWSPFLHQKWSGWVHLNNCILASCWNPAIPIYHNSLSPVIYLICNICVYQNERTLIWLFNLRRNHSLSVPLLLPSEPPYILLLNVHPDHPEFSAPFLTSDLHILSHNYSYMINCGSTWIHLHIMCVAFRVYSFFNLCRTFTNWRCS